MLSTAILSCLALFLASLPHPTVGFATNKRIITSPTPPTRISVLQGSSTSIDDPTPTTYHELTNLPRHPTNTNANTILIQTERAIRSMQKSQLLKDEECNLTDEIIPLPIEQESVYANSYVDLSKVSTIGFDYDYTLVTYTQELLELIYDMALKRLVEEKEYPREMLESGLKFDPFFSIRGEFDFDSSLFISSTLLFCSTSYTTNIKSK
jgi:hypothetical protein